MATDNSTEGPDRDSGIDNKAWVENQVLANELTAAQQRLNTATEAGTSGTRLRRLERQLDAAAEAIYLYNKGLARSIAKRYAQRARDPEDLYQIADEAMWRSIKSWNPEASPLGSWAYRYIEKACRAHVARDEHGLSVWSWEHRPAVLAAKKRLEDLGEHVTPARVAELANVTIELATLILERQQPGANRSLDAIVGEGGATLGDLLVLEDPEVVIDDDDDTADALAALTADLGIVELFVWLRTNGADQALPWPTEALEQTLGVSAETVRRAARRGDQKIQAASPAGVLVEH